VKLNWIAVAACLVAPLAGAADTPDVGRLAWLEGRWAGEKEGTSTVEQWSPVTGGALLSFHTDVKAGKLVWWEFARIDRTPEGVFYFASPQSAPPTPFKLVEQGDKRVVFENKQHDYPQRILYWLDAQGDLHARIEGPMNGQTATEEWTWRRAR
jgi:hypothetical protein